MAPEAAEFSSITQNNGHYVVQGHRYWHQSKTHMQLLITSYIIPFPSYYILLVKFALLTGGTSL